MTVESLWRVLVAPALRARDLTGEQITPVEGLPALSLDALTSVAYGPPVRQQLDRCGIGKALGQDAYVDTPGEALEAFRSAAR